MAKGQGSPSPRRLEDYDEIRAKMKRMESALKSIAAHDGPGFPHGTCAKIAAEALDSENAGGMARELAAQDSESPNRDNG
jgi:hypothetical protein